MRVPCGQGLSLPSAGLGRARSRVLAAVMSLSLVTALASAFSMPAHADDPSEPEPSAVDAALTKAKETGSPVEVAGRTSETTKTSALPDGTFEYETSPVPVRVKRDGVYQDADLTLQRSDGGIASRMSVNGVTFGAGGDDVLATMTGDGGSLALTWAQGVLPEPVLNGDSATYVDAGGVGIDVVVRSMPTGWSHYVVVRTPEAAKNGALSRIVFGIRANGLRLEERSGSRVVAVDDSGKEVFTAPEPLMWEGNVPSDQTPAQSSPEEIAAGPAPRAAVKPMDVEVTSGSLALIPDQDLLTAPDTQFPIVIDPSWQTWNGSREGNDGYGSRGAGWAYVDRTWPNSKYWKPDRLPTGREVEDYTDKRSYIRMDASPLHVWSGNVKVKVNSVDITFDTLHAWSCVTRDVRLFNVEHINSNTTWNSRPGVFIPAGSGWSTNWLSTARVNVGRPECGDTGKSNDVRFTGANLTRLMQWATDNKWDIFTIGLFPDKDYNDTHTWKVMDVDPRMVVKFSRVPMPAKDVHMKNGGTTKYACTRGDGRPWVGTSRDRTLHAKITDYDGDQSGGARGQPMRAQYELAPLGRPAESWNRYSPAGGGYQVSEPDGYLHAAVTAVKGDESSGPDGGTGWMWRVRGQDDTGLSGPWSAWCEFTVDGKRPVQPIVSSPEYPAGQTSGYDAANRKYETATFTLAPGSSGDVVKFHYRFADGAEGEKKVSPGQSATFTWAPERFGWQWVEVTSFDRAGNPSPIRKYEFGVEQPPRDAAWSMDEEAGGTVAHAVGGSGEARPNANIVFPAGVTMGQPGNLGAATPADRSVRLDGSSQFGEVVPVLDSDPDGEPVSLVDTSQRFMFSTWAKLASTTGDQVIISQATADDSVFELGWLSGKWTFRHRNADETTIAQVTRDMPQAGDGTPWTDHWISLMGGYDPINGKIWLRTQAEGETEVCPPDEPWNCTPRDVMSPQIKTADTSWTPAAGDGALLYGASVTATGAKTSYWNGWIDDSQLWPLAAPDETVLNVIYGASVQEREFAGRTLRLVNVNSGACLDVANGAIENETDVIQWNCNAGAAQDWQFTDVGDGYYTLTNPKSGRCLDVDGTDGSGTADGRNVWQYDCNGGDGQKWKPEKKAGGYWLKSKRSDKCLALSDSSAAPGASAVQWTCQDPVANDQLWNITAQKLHELHGVTYRLKGAAGGKCLETASGATTDGANVIQWACNDAVWQDWKFTHQGNGYYTLTNAGTLSDPHDAMCLEVSNSSVVAGDNVQQGLCDPGAPRQAWKVVNIADDGAKGYRLVAQHSGMVLDVEEGSTADGANVVQNIPVEPVPAHQIWQLACLPGQNWRCPQ